MHDSSNDNSKPMRLRLPDQDRIRILAVRWHLRPADAVTRILDEWEAAQVRVTTQAVAQMVREVMPQVPSTPTPQSQDEEQDPILVACGISR